VLVLTIGRLLHTPGIASEGPIVPSQLDS